MKIDYTEKGTDAVLMLSDDYVKDYPTCPETPGLFKLFWNYSDSDITFIVDEVPIIVSPDNIISLTPIQKYRIDAEGGIRALFFNRAFYCILDHDHEVSCAGLMFFGSSDTPVIKLDEIEKSKFELLHHVFVDELHTKDNKQGEMLRMLLKRLIIKTTRLIKEQTLNQPVDDKKLDTLRQFNVLVEEHYKQKKHVADYADMLNKSPKTIANVFSAYSNQTPLQVIHNRLILEARRLFTYTDKPAKEVALDLGFDDQAHFSRFFKKETGLSPSDFKKSQKVSV